MSVVSQTIPNWIAAVGTGGAFLTAAVAFAIDRKNRVRRQASQASAYLALPEDREALDRERVLHIANDSSEPVYRLEIWPRNQALADPLWFDVLPPGSHIAVPASISLASSKRSEYSLGINLRFVDASGLSWQRVAPHYQLTSANLNDALVFDEE